MHYPDLGSARHQYAISALVTQTSFCKGSSGDLAKRRLFSQATSCLTLEKQFSSQYFFTVDLESVYESHTKPGVPVYKLSTVDSERRNKFRLVVVVVLIDNARSKEFVSRPFLLRSRTSASKTAGRFRSLSV